MADSSETNGGGSASVFHGVIDADSTLRLEGSGAVVPPPQILCMHSSTCGACIATLSRLASQPLTTEDVKGNVDVWPIVAVEVHGSPAMPKALAAAITFT